MLVTVRWRNSAACPGNIFGSLRLILCHGHHSSIDHNWAKGTPESCHYATWIPNLEFPPKVAAVSGLYTLSRETYSMLVFSVGRLLRHICQILTSEREQAMVHLSVRIASTTVTLASIRQGVGVANVRATYQIDPAKVTILVRYLHQQGLSILVTAPLGIRALTPLFETRLPLMGTPEVLTVEETHLSHGARA